MTFAPLDGSWERRCIACNRIEGPSDTMPQAWVGLDNFPMCRGCAERWRQFTWQYVLYGPPAGVAAPVGAEAPVGAAA
jgi:hypothetical protein